MAFLPPRCGKFILYNVGVETVFLYRFGVAQTEVVLSFGKRHSRLTLVFPRAVAVRRFAYFI